MFHEGAVEALVTGPEFPGGASCGIPWVPQGRLPWFHGSDDGGALGLPHPLVGARCWGRLVRWVADLSGFWCMIML